MSAFSSVRLFRFSGSGSVRRSAVFGRRLLRRGAAVCSWRGARCVFVAVGSASAFRGRSFCVRPGPGWVVRFPWGLGASALGG